MSELLGPILVGVTASGVAALFFKTLIKTSVEETVKLTVNKHLEDYKSTLERELEKLRHSLKNAETFFTMELESLTELRKLRSNAMPVATHPEMEWNEACDIIANSFPKHEKALEDFLACYETVLPVEVTKKLEAARSRAAEGKFQLVWVPELETLEATSEGNESVNAFVDALKEAIEMLQSDVNSQVAGKTQ